MPSRPRDQSRPPFAARTRLASAVLLLATGILGCDAFNEDVNDFTEKFSPPSPFQAAVWASDFNDPGLQRKGVILLSNATFGGDRTYVDLYRVLATESPDPLVRSSGIRALGRWGEPEDAIQIADQLENDYRQVRLEAAIALQRLHEPAVEDRIWRRLIDENEDEAIRIELAIALGQYPTDAAFQALALALEDRSLALNLAASDSLRVLTGRDFGVDAPAWLSWYDSTDAAFADVETFLYPTFERPISFFEKLAFWAPVDFEKPGVPRGLDESSDATYEEGDTKDAGSKDGTAKTKADPDRTYENVGEGP